MGNSSYFRFDDDDMTKYIYILSIITTEMGKLKTYCLIYCIMGNGENMLNLTHMAIQDISRPQYYIWQCEFLWALLFYIKRIDANFPFLRLLQERLEMGWHKQSKLSYWIHLKCVSSTSVLFITILCNKSLLYTSYWFPQCTQALVWYPYSIYGLR